MGSAFCVCISEEKEGAAEGRRAKASVVGTVQSAEEKKEAGERPPGRAAGPQPSGHSPSLLLLPLSSPLLFLSSADWCSIHGGPISPFSVLRPLATIHANEVEQMTFFFDRGCMRVCVCLSVCVGGWMGRLLNSSNLSCLQPNQLLYCSKSC